MKLEVRTFVRHGIPWICSICPTCSESVCQSENFCKKCGQELSFENFKVVVERDSFQVERLNNGVSIALFNPKDL